MSDLNTVRTWMYMRDNKRPSEEQFRGAFVELAHKWHDAKCDGLDILSAYLLDEFVDVAMENKQQA